jgi:hypothetical protein
LSFAVHCFSFPTAFDGKKADINKRKKMSFSRLQDEKISHKEAATEEALQGNNAAIIPKVDNSNNL